MSRVLTVGIGDCGVSAEPGAQIVTYALGSCVGVAMHDPVAKVGGLLHYMLPLSVLDPRQAQTRPFLYCDTGLPLMLERLYQLGAEKKRLVIHAAGGAQVINDNGFFNIGQKNERILRQIAAAYKLPLAGEALGGNISRTVGLDVGSGRFWIKHWRVDGETGRTVSERRCVGAT